MGKADYPKFDEVREIIDKDSAYYGMYGKVRRHENSEKFMLLNDRYTLCNITYSKRKMRRKEQGNGEQAGGE